MKATYTPATDAKLIQWAAEGVPVRQQARRLNVSEDTVASWRRRLRLSRPCPVRVITPEDDAKIKSWIEDGWPLKEIAETSGYSLPQIRREYPGAGLQDPKDQGSLAAARLHVHVMRRSSILVGL